MHYRQCQATRVTQLDEESVCISYQPEDPFRNPSGQGQQAAPLPAYGAGAASSGPYGAGPYGGYGPVGGGPYGGYGPVGKVRHTGVVFLLGIITFGFYGLYWWYATHAELRDHTGEGMGGGVALVIAIFFSPILNFTLPAEIERAYQRRGIYPPVSAATGLWAIPGFLILVGPLVWLIKVNGALNAYWRSLGAVG